MAGGSGSRLSPLTIGVNKQLLPVFDKPLIYYPLSTLMLAGIKEILLISSGSEIGNFKKVLKNGSQFGISIEYAIQEEPKGIAQGLIIAEDFIKNHKICLILGDNLFHGPGLGRQLASHRNVSGAHLFAYQVSDPENYGILEFDKSNNVVDIHEKPKSPKSNFAVTGLYFYDEQACGFAKSLNPSSRGELEITDLNKKYLRNNQLEFTILSRGTAWLDTGTFKGLHDASSYIRVVQERQNANIGNPHDVAIAQGWI
jgi:glucose-1-phosphate thymidylyltransferase